nr:type II/IV secretion system ATPase subunit [Halorarius litoreus]
MSLPSTAGNGTDVSDEHLPENAAEAPDESESDGGAIVDAYSWEDFKREYYYDESGEPPRKSKSEVVSFDAESYLGFDPDDTEQVLGDAAGVATRLDDIVTSRTVRVDPELDEDAFFSTVDGHPTVVNRYDLEKAVEPSRKPQFIEVDRYWVDKPYAFVIIFHSTHENEKKYYLVGPHLNPTEQQLKRYLTAKLRTSIKYSDEVVVRGSRADRVAVIERELRSLLEKYGLYRRPATKQSLLDRVRGRRDDSTGDAPAPLEGIAARPEPAVVAEDASTLTAYQVAKLEYLLVRDFIGFERIDGIKHDIKVEDISCDGYESPVFVYHSEYEQLITNVSHGESELDRFVVKLAQRSGKSISKRHPQVDATLPDGSRAQLTLGREVSDHGTNYTIRQFNDVPFTPVDLVNWHTFSLEEMVFLWLCIENNKSLLFAGGTASGKTTSLNAVSLFIPSKAKIVSIEDTREVELPQRNWVASVTRPSFSRSDDGDIDEFDLLEAALRQRPEYLLMGEIRGEEGRTLFQVMSTGHTTLTTFHADSVDEVLKRFTTDPINVSKTMFTALDLVSVQAQTRVKGRKIRRNKVLTEINHYDPERDEINVTDVHTWRPETDEFSSIENPRLLEEIQFDRGWTADQLADEIFKRRVVLAYLIYNGLNEYAEVAATIQAFMNDPDTVLALIARDCLAESLETLRKMESVVIDIDPEKEALVPRPDPDERTYALAAGILTAAEELLFERYATITPSPLVDALPAIEPAAPIVATPPGDHAVEADGGDDEPATEED